jgi:hypothetical protein
VGTSHSATGAIESALEYVSPDTHWIERRLATAGGKRIKMLPLSAIETDHSDQSSYIYQYRTSLNQLLPATASTSQQHSYTSSDRRPARGSTTCRTCTNLAGRYKSPLCLITSAATSLPCQQRQEPLSSGQTRVVTFPQHYSMSFINCTIHQIILWHIALLLGNNHEISSHTTAVAT